MSNIRIIFVLPPEAETGSDASEIMNQAYDCCKMEVDNTFWAQESELLQLELNKSDYLIFESVENKDFSQFIERKCAVLGPLAISICLTEGKTIPNVQWPIQNVTLHGCQITCSQLPKKEKEQLKNKIQLMGGLYIPQFTESITHLICGGTKSEKYMLAVEKGVKLMLPDWIHHLFEESKTRNVSAKDTSILEKFKCPALHNLVICTTGLSVFKERQKLSEIIVTNGGTMVMKLNLGKTDILVCHGNAGTCSDKYKAAKSHPNISCVTIDWIFDSVEKGFALPHEKYKVKAMTSTPTKEDENADPNFSTVSSIGFSRIQKTLTNNSIDCTNIDFPTPFKQPTRNKRKSEEDLNMDNIDIKKVKNAGNFLDGCSIYVTGFSPAYKDKLNKIVNISGATRYDSYSTRVSHVIVGDPKAPEVKEIMQTNSGCYLLNPSWLLESVEQKKPADEEKYSINNITDGIKEMNSRSVVHEDVENFSSLCNGIYKQSFNDKVEADPTVVDHEKEDSLTQKYLHNAIVNKNNEEDTLAKILNNKKIPTLQNTEDFHCPMPNEGSESTSFHPENTSTQLSETATDTSNYDIPPIFKHLKLLLYDLDIERLENYKKNIIMAQGTVIVNQPDKICDYAVLSVNVNELPKFSAKQIVSEFWLIDCMEKEALCDDIQYYHRVIVSNLSTQEKCPLEDCVVTLSGYSGTEREYLKYVILTLGATCQEVLSRKTLPEKNILASTHLVCPEPSGKKYDAAVKWNIFVGNKNWLLECLKTRTKIAIDNFSIQEKSSHQMSTHVEEMHNSVPNRSSVSTPTRPKPIEDDSFKTPKDQIYKMKGINTPAPCSQVTPINKILQEAINNKILPTPPTSSQPCPITNIQTPDTPLGAFIRPNPSPSLRKEMQMYVNSFPDFEFPKRRDSTPLSDLKKRLWDKALGRGEYTEKNAGSSEQDEVFNVKTDENQPTIEYTVVHQKLQELQQRVMAKGVSSADKKWNRTFEASTNVPGVEKSHSEIQSQICTVGWDYGEQLPKTKVFMVSGFQGDQRVQIISDLESLGALFAKSDGYDEAATHLICSKPGKNEKTLASMAAGKWILHISYVEKSLNAGHLLDEEEFEFGNPKAKSNIFYEERESCICFWRREIARRGYGAFNDIRAIVIAENREPILKVIKAGGGAVVNVQPPFYESIHATHCFIELKSVKDYSKLVVLAQQGIKCLNTIYIHDFLWRNQKNEIDYIIPYLSKYCK